MFYNDVQGWTTVGTDIKLLKTDTNLNELWGYTQSYDTAHYISNFVQTGENEFVSVGFVTGSDYNPDLITLRVIVQNQTDYIAPNITTDFLNSLSSGWHLLGTNSDINDMSVFDNTEIVWRYEYDGKWYAYKQDMSKVTAAGYDPIISLKRGEGFWVYKK